MSFTALALPVLLISIVGAIAGFAGGLFGIGGGIIMVPALYVAFGFIDVAPEVRLTLAIGTSLGVIIITSLRSVSAHHKAGHVDVSVLKYWLIWISLGAFAAGFIADYIPTRILTLFFAVSAGVIGVMRIAKGLSLRRQSQQSAPPCATTITETQHAPSPWITTFAPVLGVATGLTSGLLGIGGGVLGVMVMGWAGRPVHQAIGTASGFGIGVAIPGTLGFVMAGLGHEFLPVGAIGFVHLPAFAILGCMTLITAPMGARTAHKLAPAALMGMFGVYVLIMAGLMAREALV